MERGEINVEALEADGGTGNHSDPDPDKDPDEEITE
jgi:hypothetical protein